MGKNLDKILKKQGIKKNKTQSVQLSISELEAAYVLCSNGNYKKPRTQARVVNKIREALMNAVLNR